MSHARTPWPRALVLAVGAILPATVLLPTQAAAQLTQKDVQIMGRALGLLEPPPAAGAVVAIVYAAGNPASRQQAETIAGYFGDGLKAGAVLLKPRLVDSAALGDGSGLAAFVTVPGADTNGVMAAARSRHIPCVSGDPALVQGGACIMSIRSDPKVEILVNRDAASTAGVVFASAFRMMFREI